MATSATIANLHVVAATEHAASGPPQPAKKIGRRPEYMFIHTVRFWCMLAIVFMHCGIKFIKYQPLSLEQLSLLVQPFKFGTIGFFLISGFLLGDRLPASNPISYLRRRANRLVPAWLFWYGAQTAFVTCRDLTRLGLHSVTSHIVLATAWLECGRCLAETALWFVPNFMVALACVVLCRRWLNDLRLGAVFLAANLFYSVNVYTCWIPSRHTEAVFGFVFYLWLGAWCALRKEKLEEWAASLTFTLLIVCACAATAGALLEAHLLSLHHRIEPLNSLRWCNQVYSVLMVIMLLRIRRVTWPRSINVAATTYGVYLTHSMVIALVFSAAAPILFRSGHMLGYVGLLSAWAILAPTAYVTSLLLTRVLAATGWPWIVGLVRTEACEPAAALVPGALQSATSPN